MAKGSKSAATIRRRHYMSPALREVLIRHKSISVNDNIDSDDDDIEYFHQQVSIQSPALRHLLSSQWTMFLSLIAFRSINAMIIQSSYVPDEYWQATEVAHKMVFGYGYLTWEWRTGLRSYLYPMVIATLYKILALLHLDYRILLIKLPRLLQAVLAATGDLYLYKLSYRLCGHQVALWSLLCQLTSWFTFYCSTRTLTNSVETVLTTVALFYFPWPEKPRKAHWKFISIVCLSIVIRPTAVVIWLPLGVWYLLLWRHVPWKVLRMLTGRGFMVLSLSSIVDRIFYGKWTFVHFNFLQFNVLYNMGTFYGSHPWHWYISQGFPVIMGSHIIPFIMAVRKGMQLGFLFLIGWTVFIFSGLGHKEFRFLFPVLPLAMHTCGAYLHYLTTEAWSEIQQKMTSSKKCDHIALNNPSETDGDSSKSKSEGSTNVADSKSKRNRKLDDHSNPINSLHGMELASQESSYLSYLQLSLDLKTWLDALYLKLEYYSKCFWSSPWRIIAALIATNLPLALYTSILHQRGTLDAMKYISDQSGRLMAGHPMSVMYLMPCHSAPYYGFVHRNITMQFLTCEPNLSNISNYTDEADIFFINPEQWLKHRRQKWQEDEVFMINGLPTHLVMFNVLQPQIEYFLRTNDYEECARFFHTHFPEGRVGSHVVVMCLSNWARHKGFHENYKFQKLYRS